MVRCCVAVGLLLLLVLSGCSVESRTDRARSTDEALVQECLRTHLPEILAVSEEIDAVSRRMCSLHQWGLARSETPSQEYFCCSLTLRELCRRQRFLLSKLVAALEFCEAGETCLHERRASMHTIEMHDQVGYRSPTLSSVCKVWLLETEQVLETVAEYQNLALPMLRDRGSDDIQSRAVEVARIASCQALRCSEG